MSASKSYTVTVPLLLLSGCSLLFEASPSIHDGGGASVDADVVAEVDGALGTNCPDGMIFIPERDFCVDRYEASVWADIECMTVQFGVSGDDYVSGFPDNVESRDCVGNCSGLSSEGPVVQPTATLYACSLSGVKPSSWLTWFQAKRACENANKVLCPKDDWEFACMGPGGTAYPYGTAHQPGICNNDQSSQILDTAEKIDCKNGFGDLFDMSGNVSEWIDACSTTTNPVCTRRGGSVNSQPSLSTCNGASAQFTPSSSSPLAGFRCCTTP